MNEAQTERQAHGSQPVRVRPGETPGSPVARLPAAGEIPSVEAERRSPWKGASNRPVCSIKRSLQRRHVYLALNGRKAAVGTGESLLGPGTREPGKRGPPITGSPGKWRGGREAVGGGRSTGDGRDNRTRPEGRAPTSPMHALARRGSGECPMRARTIRKAEGLDASRALQAVLYRSAKQDPTRRFHALYDKVARADVLVRAWGEVRANRGAPGVDGTSIEDVEESGVETFLEQT